MKTKIIARIVWVNLLIGGAFFANSQTGPAGVGNSTTNKIWLDASHLTGITDGMKITTFQDRSGNGWNAVQNTVSRRPTYLTNQLNGKPVVRFDRTAAIQYMELTASGIGSVFSNSNSVFIVCKANTGAFNSTPNHIQALLIWSNGHNSVISFSGYPNATGVYMNNYLGAASDYVSKSASLSQGAWQLIARTLTEDANGSSLAGFLNGTALGTPSSNTLQMANQPNMVRMGAASPSGTFTYPLNGDIAEVITYNVALSESERVIVENYLSVKYNVIISSDKYALNGATYTLDVQGIGTADGNSLSKHSTASNSRGLKLDESNSSLDAAGEFLLAGHATNNNSIINVDLPEGVDERWQRDWYLEKTGSIDAKLSFDLSDAGLTVPANIGTEYSYYKLLYRSSSTDFFTVVPITPVLENGDQISFPLVNAQLLNGYYTVGYSQALIWTGAQDQQWNQTSNWNLNRIPTAEDRVIVNACTVCPALNSDVDIANIQLNTGSLITLNSYLLSVGKSTSVNESRIVSNHGKIQSTDFLEIRRSAFEGSVVLEKTGGVDNTCYGGNTFSTELKMINSSSNVWHVTSQSDNVIKAF